MARLTREQFLSHDDKAPLEFESPRWGGSFSYRMATVTDRAAARRRAQTTTADGKSEVDYDRFGAALIILCTIDPPLQPQDIEALMEKSSQEIERYVNTILGSVSANPR